MNMKKIIIITLLFLVSISLKAQDFGIWYETNAISNIQGKVDFKFSSVLRTDNLASNTQMFYMEPGVVFNFNKYFSSGLYYRYIYQYTDTGYMLFNRWSFELNGKIPIDKFNIGLRYRLQDQSTGYHELDVWFSRLKLQLDYNLKPFRPYISTEMFTQMSQDYLPDRWRHIIGLEYKINEHHAPAIEYIWYGNSSKYINVLSLKYSLKF